MHPALLHAGAEHTAQPYAGAAVYDCPHKAEGRDATARGSGRQGTTASRSDGIRLPRRAVPCGVTPRGSGTHDATARENGGHRATARGGAT